MRWRQWLRWPWLREVVLALILFFGIRAYQRRGMPSGPAPSLAGVDLRGETVSLADYRGKPVLLHFGATWCGVCKAEQHNIDALMRDLPVLNVESLSGSASDIATIMGEGGPLRHVIVDEQGTIAHRFGVRAYPTTFVVDGQGLIRYVEVGYTTEIGMRLRMWLAAL
jgi:peroxiredoxin